MIADRFQSGLKSDLQAALKLGGPETAVAVCAEAAPAIATRVSEEMGADVRRISLHPRNSAATVDGDLRQRLERLAENPLDTKGQPSITSWVDTTGAVPTHYSMRAVVMQEQPCTICHGKSIAPNVQAAIAARYPEDQATGSLAGDLRGAILVSMPQGSAKRPGDTK